MKPKQTLNLYEHTTETFFTQFWCPKSKTYPLWASPKWGSHSWWESWPRSRS